MSDTSSAVSVSEAIAPSAWHPAERATRRTTALVRGAALLACLDSLAAVTAIIAVLISENLPSMTGGLEGFLAVRVSVKNVLLLLVLASAWPAVFHLFGLYYSRRIQRVGSEVWRVAAATAVGCGVAVLFPLTSVSRSLTAGDLQKFWLAATSLCLLVRFGRRAVAEASPRHRRRTLIVGSGRLARVVHQDLLADRSHRVEVVGFVDGPHDEGPAFDRIAQAPVGTIDELEQILMRQVIDEVIIALPVKSRYQQIQYAIGVCERAGVPAKYGAELFESRVAFPRYDDHGGRAFVAMRVVSDSPWLIVKRAMDIVGAAVGLILFAPVMLAVAIAIKLTSPGPVIYAQARCGLNKRALRMYKFRSMLHDADQRQSSLEDRNEASGPVFKIRNDPRVTRIGRFLRQSSLDELPQLWNVLCGDMSLVGPRPLPWRDVHRITRPADMRRFSMRPGLTCLWQVEGRNRLGFERWVELDLQYIDTWSIAQDVRILLKTVPAVLSGDGAT